MVRINAAVVTDLAEPPAYGSIDLRPLREGEELVDVLAAGLHPRVRSGASGSHYTSTGRLPLVPGIDGVGRRDDGSLVYFALDDDRFGSLATRVIVDPRRVIALPNGADVVRVAAAMNPAMSSWVALRRRIALAPGAAVLVLGATGNAGTMAVQIAKLLGVGSVVVAAGRDTQRLARLTALGADATVALADDPRASAAALAEVAADVDVVLDYLWGAPTEAAIPALLRARADRSRAIDWIEIGSVAGPDISLPSAALRSAHLRLIGSGQGSIGGREYLAELPSLVDAIDDGRIDVTTRTARIADVRAVWIAPEEPGVRTVFVP
ncbi:zinc-binding alcohol dehydrogenase family protein [Microbacterium sp. SORGH_AS_0888]|uniref:quinone oxidoreductase family protein n=1 Tax=Microbacterium sp. SORGH_AS_0888 TaxID=3041791 RepID=UPI00278067D2|nr:zinc-binding alcohol dehydrogenase family protein [Microbacterium sp. SORGH_AS_0888]MDQ1128668.1 NADPH:quinone reductase-like Zn-dependent oxidoreductase [Microbacterium sp. SORGH_AS_0888]